MKVRKTQEGGVELCFDFLHFLLSWNTLIRSNSRTASEVMFRTKLQQIKTEREKEERHKTIIQVPSTNRK